MAEPLATREDVEAALLRPLTDTEAAYIDALLVNASSRLRQATRQTVDARMALDPADPRWLDKDTVASVVATVVKRFMSNPDGAVAVSEGGGPYSTSRSYALRGDKDIRGEMVITDQDLEALAPEIPAQVGTITVAPSPTLQAGMRATRHTAGQVFATPVVPDQYGRIW